MDEIDCYSDVVANVFDTEEFSNELYKVAIDTAINRFETVESWISEQELLDFVQKLFQKSNAMHQEAVKREMQSCRSNTCVLKVDVIRAENLASKDSDGLSDPFCVVSVLPTSQFVDLNNGKYNTKKTKIIDDNLNPVWNEHKEFVLNRDEISKSYFQLQVWDYDGANDNKKKTKGLKGLTRYVQDIFSAGDEHDFKHDFMGFKSVKLSKIPDEGLEKWLKCKPSYALQRVSGQVKVKLSLSALRKDGHLKYGVDLLYSALLKKMLEFSYQNQNPHQKFCWNCDLPPCAEIILNEFLQQHHLPQPHLTLTKWETYAAQHLNYFPGIKAKIIEDLLHNLNLQEGYKQKEKFRLSSTKTFTKSVEKFIQEECAKIARHREVFPAQKEKDSKGLENLLKILKILGSKETRDKIRSVSADAEYDVRVSVLYALENGSSSYYISLQSKHISDSSSKIETKEKDCDENGEEIEVEGMVSLTEALYKDLTEGQAAYSTAFRQSFDISYVTTVGSVLHKHLASATNDLMTRMNGILYKQSGCSKGEGLTAKLTSLFRLHKILHQFLNLTDCSNNNNNQAACDECAAFEETTTVKCGVTEIDAPISITHQHHRQWFLPVVFKWVHLCKEENQKILEEAIRVDESVKRVDDIVKHSLSAVDTVTCLNATVQTWNSWEWPNPFDSYTIAMWLANDVAQCVELYADLLYEKLKDVGFFDDVGQFDVTEQLCFALNNLHRVKTFLMELPETMLFQLLADGVHASSEGLRGEEALLKLNAVVHRADKRMEEKIKTVSSEVGARMKPDISKHLITFAESAIQSKREASYKGFGNSEAMSNLRGFADKASHSLMDYLADNLKTLSEWLNQKNFDIILGILWETVVQCMHQLVLTNWNLHGPAFFYQSRYLLENLLYFFHEDGSGLTMNHMKKLEEYKRLDAELKIRSASTADLVKMFYLQMHKKQENTVSCSNYGVLDVFAWYDLGKSTLHVDVISANDLAPLDINGLSDPFVQLRLAPPMLFKQQSTVQTDYKKKTLHPLWNEEFTFQVEKKIMEEDGNVIIFAVFDYDVFASNELEGEAVIPLKIILSKAKEAKKEDKVEKHFKLPLQRMKKRRFFPKLTNRQEKPCDGRNNSSASAESYDSDGSSSSDESLVDDGEEFEVLPSVSPMQLLRARCSVDKDAEEFIKSRRKFKKAKKIRTPSR